MPNLTKYVKNDNITYVVEKYWIKNRLRLFNSPAPQS